MGFFSKPKNPINNVSKIFLDQFPTWSVQHATKMVAELKQHPKHETEKNCAELIKKDQAVEKILIDCLTGAHAVYLSELPEGHQLLLGGDKKIVQAISKWSEKSKQFFMVALTFHKRITEAGTSDIASSLEDMFGGDGKLEPMAVHIGTVITQTIEKDLNKDLGPFFVAGLYRKIFELQQEQLDWIVNEVLEKAKKIG